MQAAPMLHASRPLLGACLGVGAEAFSGKIGAASVSSLVFGIRLPAASNWPNLGICRDRVVRTGAALSVKVAKALKLGIAGKVRVSLDAALELEPKHAEAHTAMALYHAEIISKIGSMIGGLTYGAKASEAEKHIKEALKLTPASPIANIEHGNLLMLLHGDKKEDDAAAAYEKAAKTKPLDAMEALDADHARSEIE